MSKALAAQRAKREALVARSSSQRDELARSLRPWMPVFDGVDSALRYASRMSLVLDVGLGALALLVPRSSGVGRLVRGAGLAWVAIRSVMHFVRR